ncbi:MAG: hypothetical protein OES38_04235 [Gammaproteobacteria bacterium]|nr:hypothetical protein [Gammaproteobacteria bacterium]
MIGRVIVFMSLFVLHACGGSSSTAREEAQPASGTQMSVSPTALQASADVGSSAALSFTVRNTGDAELTFQATTSDSWISGLENLGSVDVSAGASNTVNLQVPCTAVGQLAGSIGVSGNAPDNPSDTISVTVDCVAPPVQIALADVPGASNGAPTVDAQSSLSWSINSSWPQQPDVSYTVTASDPGVTISNATGTAALAGQIQNNLSYACPAPTSLTATITIDAGGSQATANWQIECVAALEGNITFERAELYQGPVAAVIGANLDVTDYVDTIAGRQTLLAVQLGHDSATVPELSIDVVEPGQTTTLVPALSSVHTPAETGNGRWASIYTLNVAAGFMDSGNELAASMDPNNQIVETNEGDNGFTIDMATLGLLRMPEFKVVFVPINAEGRVPATVVPAEYLEATLDLFPIADSTSSVRGVYDYQGGAWDWQTAINEMSALWNAEGAADEFYHGVYRQPNNFGGGTTGIGFIGFPVSVSTSLDSPLGNDQTIAHEFGHNFGLGHAPGGCNEATPDPDYPYPFGGIGPFGGWLFSEASYIAPESGYFDVMTYCRPQFISDYHYQKVVDTFNVGQMVSTQSAVGVTNGSIALSGSVDEYGVWRMTHITESARPARAANPGPFVVALYGDDGVELYRQSFDCHYTDHARFAVWAVRVPKPSVPVAAVRVWDASGNLILDEATTS